MNNYFEKISVFSKKGCNISGVFTLTKVEATIFHNQNAASRENNPAATEARVTRRRRETKRSETRSNPPPRRMRDCGKTARLLSKLHGRNSQLNREMPYTGPDNSGGWIGVGLV